MAEIGTKLIAAFVKAELQPRLAPDYTVYARRDLVRLHGPFVQLLALSVSRGGALRVHPTFYVAGADLALTVVPQNASLEVLDPRKWSFTGIPLNSDFADNLVRNLEAESPLSFVTPLAAARVSDIERVFHHFTKRGVHWSDSLYLAHFLMAQGHPGAAAQLRIVRDRFTRLGAKVVGAPPPWRVVLGERISTLEQRLTEANGRDLCRADSDRQAAELGLPKIVWDQV